MRQLPRLFLFAAFVAGAGLAWGQTAPSIIQGTVLSAEGKPVPRASLYYGRTARVKGKDAGAVLPPVLSAKAGMDGRFTLSNLPPGSWTVCVEAAGHLNPCHWSTAPAFMVAAGHTVPNATIRVDQAYTFHIRINDPQGLLANEGRAGGAFLQIGVHAPSGAFQRAVLAGKDAKGRNYTVAMPLRAAAKLFVSGGAFQLNDDAGGQLSKSGKLTSVPAPDPNKAGTAGPPLGFTVTGLGKP